MDLLNRTLLQIRTVLIGLTMSQRLLIGLLVVVMVGTLYFVVLASRKPDMVELLPQTLTADEISTITSYLHGKYEVVENNGRLMVPSEKAYQIRGELADAQALPRDTTVAFARLAEANNYLLPDAEIERKWGVARQDVLSRIIRNFPYIADANVIISKGTPVGLGRSGEPSSATIAVRLKAGQMLTSPRVLAIVDTVRGAVSGLKRENIHLTDGTRAYSAPNEDNPVPTDQLEYKRTIEDDLVRKLQNQFSHMGDVKIAVNVVPDMSARTLASTTYDPKVVKAPLEETTKDSNSSDGLGSGGQPGVQPNVTANAGSGTSGGVKNSTTVTETVTHMENKFSQTVKTESLPPGTEIKELTASISLPRSYFRSLFRRTAKDETVEPTDEQLQPTVDRDLKRVRAIARLAIGAKADDQVQVDWFDDTLVLRPEMAPEKAGILNAGSITGMLGLYSKQVVLGALAVGGLLMMLMMVRKSAPSLAGAGANTNVFLGGGGGGTGGMGGKNRSGYSTNEAGTLDVGEDIIGEAGAGEAVLTGIELDDETLQSRKMVDEVSTMIKENPENAASLVKRWISKSK